MPLAQVNAPALGALQQGEFLVTENLPGSPTFWAKLADLRAVHAQEHDGLRRGFLLGQIVQIMQAAGLDPHTATWAQLQAAMGGAKVWS